MASPKKGVPVFSSSSLFESNATVVATLERQPGDGGFHNVVCGIVSFAAWCGGEFATGVNGSLLAGPYSRRCWMRIVCVVDIAEGLCWVIDCDFQKGRVAR